MNSWCLYQELVIHAAAIEKNVAHRDPWRQTKAVFRGLCAPNWARCAQVSMPSVSEVPG